MRPPEEVHVWRARRSHWDQSLERLLDRPERSRLAALRRPRDRELFTLAAAVLRFVAGRELGCPPWRVQVGRRCARCGGPHGKPAVQLPAGGLEVSVSHGADVVVVAATWLDPVGVDVERIDPALAVDDLAPLCLAPEEAAVLAGLTGPDRARAFLSCWTRKEAVLKAAGTGLLVPPSEVPVIGSAAFGTFVTGVDVAAGYVGAVAVMGPARPVRLLDAGVLLAA